MSKYFIRGLPLKAISAGFKLLISIKILQYRVKNLVAGVLLVLTEHMEASVHSGAA